MDRSNVCIVIKRNVNRSEAEVPCNVRYISAIQRHGCPNDEDRFEVVQDSNKLISQEVGSASSTTQTLSYPHRCVHGIQNRLADTHKKCRSVQKLCCIQKVDDEGIELPLPLKKQATC